MFTKIVFLYIIHYLSVIRNTWVEMISRAMEVFMSVWYCINVYSEEGIQYIFRNAEDAAHFRFGGRDIQMLSYAAFLDGREPSAKLRADYGFTTLQNLLTHLGFEGSNFVVDCNM